MQSPELHDEQGRGIDADDLGGGAGGTGDKANDLGGADIQRRDQAVTRWLIVFAGMEHGRSQVSLPVAGAAFSAADSGASAGAGRNTTRPVRRRSMAA